MGALQSTFSFLVACLALCTSNAIPNVNRRVPALELLESRSPPLPLVNFQVQQPPALSRHPKHCTVELVHHLFRNSYYQREFLEMYP